MEIVKVACVGTGLIGHSWATLFASKGYMVTIQDQQESTLTRALNRIRSNLDFLARKGLLEEENPQDLLKRINVTTSLSKAVKNVDYVQESVFENYNVKKAVFREMDAAAQKDTIFASSSSGLLITEIQKATTKPDRCLIAHPFNPPHLIPLVELVPGEQTSPEVVNVIFEFMRKIGKVPVVLQREVPGHIANRLSAALWREAIDLVDKGVASVEDVDKALRVGPAIRWALMGVHLTYHLGGGSGGIEQFVDNLSPAFSSWWKTMDAWTSIPSSAATKVIEGVREMNLVQTKTREDIENWRDEKILAILKVISGHNSTR
jgi:3-hydroxypropionate dehydrogenase (NADP+)